MTEIKSTFDAIQSISSKTGKENILKQEKDNYELKQTLNFLLNPYITTGLSAKKINKQVKTQPTIILPDTFAAMQYLQENNTGSDEIIANIQAYINNQAPDMVEFHQQLFTKSLKLGCAANTVNKVFGKGFIPQMECMLAEKYFDFADRVAGRDFSITLKLDGVRALVVKQGNSVKLFSRQGQPITGLVELEKEFIKMTNKDFVLDGELLITDTEGIPSKEQYKATMKIVRKDGDKLGITYRAFDYLGLEEFQSQESFNPYTTRRSILEQGFSDMSFTKVLPLLYSGNDDTQISYWLEKVRADGEEGVMVSLNDGLYEFKRTRNLLKVKVMENCDLRIIGFEEGQGRLSGTLGKVSVSYKGNLVGVGSGFTDDQRTWFWQNQESLRGRVVSVNYFEETQDADGNLSLRFPVFKELRDVGKEPSYA